MHVGDGRLRLTGLANRVFRLAVSVAQQLLVMFGAVVFLRYYCKKQFKLFRSPLEFVLNNRNYMKHSMLSQHKSQIVSSLLSPC